MFSESENTMEQNVSNDIDDIPNDMEMELFAGKVFPCHDSLLDFVEAWSKRTLCPLAKLCMFWVNLPPIPEIVRVKKNH